MEQGDPQQCKTTMYTLHFKLIITYNSETWTLTRRNKGKIQVRNMTFSLKYCIAGKKQ
jgi:hypothetical protein